MNTWDYLVVEAYCFADTEEPPCGKGSTSGFCLLGCPYFGHCDATLREAAIDVPLHYILWDKLCERADALYWEPRWHLWDRWHYGDSWLDDIPHVQLGEDELPEFMHPDTEAKFRLWLHRVSNGETIQKGE